MNEVDIQLAVAADNVPSAEQLQGWVDSALADYPADTELVIRIVDQKESSELNRRYRHKSGPTNILSFPFAAPKNVPLNLLGDLVICAPVLAQEARDQGKPLQHHWAHIVVHGVLHLLGYDHDNDAEAEIMEAEEIKILAQLNITNPYHEA
ncbi:MAG: rRNA maturation RNase YbeY [Gammaproteobacteria bacterium HGW-Gammaproteobacteria-3]|nr:MAG: rRNA maturation RNase YbeY [Gammaproteobacteria bacterium HGW-Gammaproteobacteria-3]